MEGNRKKEEKGQSREREWEMKTEMRTRELERE